MGLRTQRRTRLALEPAGKENGATATGKASARFVVGVLTRTTLADLIHLVKFNSRFTAVAREQSRNEELALPVDVTRRVFS